MQVQSVRLKKYNPFYKLIMVIRNDRTNNVCIAFLVHVTVAYRSIDLQLYKSIHPYQGQHLEQQAIKPGTPEFILVYVYNPSASSSPTGYTANISHLSTLNDRNILGDFNANKNLWYTNKPTATTEY